jgi:hypothetical protein
VAGACTPSTSRRAGDRPRLPRDRAPRRRRHAGVGRRPGVDRPACSPSAHAAGAGRPVGLAEALDEIARGLR